MAKSIRAPRTTQRACRRKRPVSQLVLRGHGMLGLAHIGVLRAFAELGVAITFITGMSLSSVVASLHANGMEAEAIAELFLNAEARHILRDAWLGHAECDRRSLGSKVHDLLPTARMLVKLLKLEPQANLRLLAYDLLTATTVSFQGLDYDLATALTACCSVPGVMRPVWSGDRVLVDCSLYGCRLDSPCKGATVVADVSVAGLAQDSALSHVDHWLHTRARLIGPEIACDSIVGGPCRSIDVRIPAETLEGCGCSEELIQLIIKAGYDAAMQALTA